MWLIRKWHSPSSMPTKLIQVTLLLGFVFITSHGLMKPKRSPLEIGLVSFTETPSKHPLFPKINKTVTVTKSTKSTVSIPVPVHGRARHVWIPGHVHNHAYIPAHHLLVPNSDGDALLLTGALHAVVVGHGHHKLELYDNIFRSHIGGFGVGIDFSGHGAGHGFHVINV